jgi:hypothetical protein
VICFARNVIAIEGVAYVSTKAFNNYISNKNLEKNRKLKNTICICSNTGTRKWPDHIS